MIERKIERQEIHCHACDRYVQFNLDLGLDGNHVLKCPNCGHEHCRVVRNGRITRDRWDQRNGQTWIMGTSLNSITYTLNSSTTVTGTNYYANARWLNFGTSST